MSTVKQVVGTRTAVLDLGTLSNANYVTSSAQATATNQPVDVVIEVYGAAGSVGGNQQLVVFIKESLDGTNYRSGPESGTTTTDEKNLKPMGSVPVKTASTTERGFFSVFETLGFVPPYYKIVVKNDIGAALTSGYVYASEVSNTVT